MPQGREGVLKQEFPMHRKLSHSGAERGHRIPESRGQSRDSKGIKQTKLHFSDMVCDSDQSVSSGNRKKPIEAPQLQRAGPKCQERVAYKLLRAHSPVAQISGLGSQEKGGMKPLQSTENTGYRGAGEPETEHISPLTQREGSGARQVHTSPAAQSMNSVG